MCNVWLLHVALLHYFKGFVLISNYMFVYVYVGIDACEWSTHVCQKWALDSPELELQVSYLTWVMETEFGSSEKCS